MSQNACCRAQPAQNLEEDAAFRSLSKRLPYGWQADSVHRHCGLYSIQCIGLKASHNLEVTSARSDEEVAARAVRREREDYRAQKVFAKEY